jgi:hypothetical protein
MRITVGGAIAAHRYVPIVPMTNQTRRIVDIGDTLSP